MIETPTKPQFQPFPTTCKRVWVPSLNRLAVRGRPDLDPRKKSRHFKCSAKIRIIKSNFQVRRKEKETAEKIAARAYAQNYLMGKFEKFCDY